MRKADCERKTKETKISSKVNKISLRRIFAIFLLFTCTSLIIEHYVI